MACVDPFPAMSKEEAERLLSRRFGKGAVSWERPLDFVYIWFPSATGRARVRRFNWQQAKYLAACPTAREALIYGKYPLDWPTD
jgi:hypothetical protein